MTATRLRSRAVLRIAPGETCGDEAVAFLQGLLTNDVSGPLPVYAGLLSAQGKCLFDLLVWRAGEALLLDCEADAAQDLVQRLSLYRLRRKLTIARDETLAVHWTTGPDAPPEALPDPRLAELGRRWIAPAPAPAPAPASTSTSTDPETADKAWLAHRLSLGVAEGRAELGDLLWLETNAAQLHGVSFTKGCYIGQENTARMNWRQKVSRRLVVVPLAESDDRRRKAAYPELGLAVDHRRVADIAPHTAPHWLAAALAAPEDEPERPSALAKGPPAPEE